MKRRQILLIFIPIISIIALLSACGQGDEKDFYLTLEYALDEAMTRRENIVRPGRDEILAASMARDVTWVWEGIANVFSNAPPVDRISAVDAIYDAQTLLAAMRQMYILYIYLGGDEAFFPVFDEIVKTLSTQAYWDTADFVDVLNDKIFTLIKDNHVFIGVQADVFDMLDYILYYFLEDDLFDLDDLLSLDGFFDLIYSDQPNITATFFSSDVQFIRTSNGFRSRERNMYVSEVIDHCKYDVFRLVIDDYGELFYTPVVALPGVVYDTIYVLNIVYTEAEETLYLAKHVPEFIERQPASLRWEGDIPIVTIMDFIHWDVENIWQMMSFTEIVYDAPVLIIDVRSNLGGEGWIAEGWMNALVGELIYPPHITLRLNTKTRQYPGSLTGQELEICIENQVMADEIYEPMILHERTYFGFGHYVNFYVPGEIIQREQLLIVLTDRFTESAGETFTDLTFSLGNSLVIGQNTSGSIIAAGTAVLMTLPRSGVPFGFGDTMFIHPEGHFTEGFGFAPDIWATGDALEAALALLRRNSF